MSALGEASTASGPTRLAWTLGLLIAIAWLLLPTAAANASPARYVYERCDSALPEAGASAGAFWSGFDQFAAGNNCAEAGGFLALYQGGTNGPGFAAWNLAMPAPSGGFTASLTANVFACNEAAPPGQTALFLAGAALAPTCTPQLQTVQVNSPSGLSGLLELRCGGACEPRPTLWGQYFAATEVDPIPPSVTDTTGSLLAGGVLHGHQTITAHFEDKGGGLSSVGLRINGLSVESPKVLNCRTAQVNNPSIVGTVALQPMPCPPTAQASWTLDTQSPPFHNGTNSVQLCANDFATIGSPNESCLGKAVEVDNSCAESPVAGGASLTAAFERNAQEKITVGYRHPAPLTGTLSSAGGQPIAGATVCVESRTLDGDAQPEVLPPLTTDAGGHFSYRVEPGPNRTVTLGYRRDAQELDRSLSYLAHARPSLHASNEHLRNRDRIHFSGQLPGPDNQGRVVILQASVLGSKRWITFRKATSADEGIFRAGYHFTATTERTTYLFRAVVPAQTDYPWVQGHSKPVRVRVAP